MDDTRIRSLLQKERELGVDPLQHILIGVPFGSPFTLAEVYSSCQTL